MERTKYWATLPTATQEIWSWRINPSKSWTFLYLAQFAIWNICPIQLQNFANCDFRYLDDGLPIWRGIWIISGAKHFSMWRPFLLLGKRAGFFSPFFGICERNFALWCGSRTMLDLLEHAKLTELFYLIQLSSRTCLRMPKERICTTRS